MSQTATKELENSDLRDVSEERVLAQQNNYVSEFAGLAAPITQQI
jgi:hypothetical protein